MTIDVFDKAADLSWQINDLKKLKDTVTKQSLIKIDILPVWGLRGGELFYSIEKELGEINKGLNEKFSAIIDEKIKELEKEFESL